MLRQKKRLSSVDDEFWNRFCDKGRTIFKRDIKDAIDSKIYIADYAFPNFANVIPRILYGKGVQETVPTEIIVLRDKYELEFELFYKSFDCKSIFLRKKMKREPKLLLLSFFEMLKFWIKDHSGEALIKMEYKGIPIGEDIYDHIERTTPRLYTIDKLHFKRDFKKLVLLYGVAIYSYDIFSKNPPLLYLYEDSTYLEAIPLRMATCFNAQVYQVVFNGRIYCIKPRGDWRGVHWHDLMREEVRKRLKSPLPDYKLFVDDYFNKRFMGEGDKEAVYAFKGKENLQRSEFLKELGLDNGKKNIFIMAHCFTDSPHGTSFLLFKDYYNWLEETLKIVASINDVNWIVKAHPARSHYGEGNEVFELTEKYNTGGLTYLPDRFSTTVLKDTADAIVTCMGTAGHEFACFGIPVIIAGGAFYAGLGFTIEPQSIEDYKKVLQNISHIKRLNNEQIDMARRSIYCSLSILDYQPFDWLDELIRDNVRIANNSECESNEANDEMLHSLNKIFEEKDKILKTVYYQKGLILGISIENEIRGLKI